MEHVPGTDDEPHGSARRGYGYRRRSAPMRVVLADPPAYTPPYDYALAGALARRARGRLVTSPFRYGGVPEAAGFEVDEGPLPAFGRMQSRYGRLARSSSIRSRARLGLADATCSICSGSRRRRRTSAPPQLTAPRLHGPRPPPAPDRPADGLWSGSSPLRPRRRPHRARARRHWSDSASTPEAPRHPPPRVPRATRRQDDGRTVLALGVIRPYKGLEDAVRRRSPFPGARLLVAGDPRIPLDDLRARRATAPSGGSATSVERRSDALSETTVAVFPYRAELDQSGALLQAIGAGVPAVVYDVGGLGEVVGRSARAGLSARRRRGLARGAPRAARRPGGARRRAGGRRRRPRDADLGRGREAHLALYEELM